VPKVILAFQDTPVKLVMLVCPVQKDHQVELDQEDVVGHKVQRDPLDLREMWDLKGITVDQDHVDFLESLVVLDHVEKSDHVEKRAHLETLEGLEHLGLMEILDQVDQVDQMD